MNASTANLQTNVNNTMKLVVELADMIESTLSTLGNNIPTPADAKNFCSEMEIQVVRFQEHLLHMNATLSVLSELSKIKELFDKASFMQDQQIMKDARQAIQQMEYRAIALSKQLECIRKAHGVQTSFN